MQNASGLRLLVAIASYGDAHRDFLRKIIQAYRSLPITVHVVVLSEAPKDLGAGVEVAVGLPSKNPWSLPFAHKKIFAREADNYDLFIYSEDDILFTRQNLDAFLRATPELASDEIAGYLLYERDEGGKVFLPNFHGHFHWRPQSAARRGRYVVAEFTNEHSAFYLLSQSQLKRAIASGGFLREPYEGRYDLLCTAATDPYTSCGFRKVICISEGEDFLLHHLPNRYVGKVGISRDEFNLQIQALTRICASAHPSNSLCEVETRLRHGVWSKSYYEKPEEILLSMVPTRTRTLLSVGCGWGATELKLKQRGISVTVFPLDSVIGAVAASNGMEVRYGTLDDLFRELGNRKFDCVLISDLLHLLPEPWNVLSRCVEHVAETGTLVLANPNFGRLSILVKRVLGLGEYGKLRSFSLSGIHAFGRESVVRQLRNLGCNVSASQWFDRTPHLGESRNYPLLMARSCGGLIAKDWVLQARRQPKRPV